MKTLTLAYRDSDDYTVFVTAEEARKWGILEPPRCSADLQLTVQPSGQESAIQGRALACRCHGGKYVSITVRLDEKVQAASAWTRQKCGYGEIAFALGASDFKPKRLKPRTENGKRPQAANSLQREVSIEVLCECLWELTLARNRGLPSGLVVVAGRTGSAKSQTARGLIYKLLTDKDTLEAWGLAKEGRRQHLITLEDPIEEPLYNVNDLSQEVQEGWSVDYTPRDKIGKDYKSLSAALKDALWQTPTVVYVGEVRTPDDWKAVLEFAGTGHLIVTTTHAGSVTETLAKIFHAVRARDPESVGRIAQRILAIVHQSPLDPSEAGTSALIPTLWRHTPAGIAGLISEGLSSVLPHFPLEGERDKCSLGRRWFVRRLLGDVKDKALFRAFDSLALERDLKGM